MIQGIFGRHGGWHSMLADTVGSCQRNRGEHVTANGTLEVEVRTLSHVFEESGVEAINFLKMDIEGGELAALMGADKLLENTEKTVIEAYHPVGGQPIAPQVVDILNPMDLRYSEQKTIECLPSRR